MATRNRIICIILLVTALSLSACGTKNSQSSSSSNAQPAAANGEAGGEGEGAEAPLVTYSDSTQGFTIGYPQPWTQDQSIPAGFKFNGGDDSLTLEFVTISDGIDLMAYVKNDSAEMRKLFTNFKQVGLAASSEVKDAVVLSFEASGKSAVTGKDYSARGDRYYMPLPDGHTAVLTVVGPSL